MAANNENGTGTETALLDDILAKMPELLDELLRQSDRYGIGDEKETLSLLNDWNAGFYKDWRKAVFRLLDMGFSRLEIEHKPDGAQVEVRVFPFTGYYLSKVLAHLAKSPHSVESENTVDRDTLIEHLTGELSRKTAQCSSWRKIDILSKCLKTYKEIQALVKKAGTLLSADKRGLWADLAHCFKVADRFDIYRVVYSCLDQDFIQEALQLPKEDLGEVMTLWQTILDKGVGNSNVLRRALFAMVKESTVLPSSMVISNIKLIEPKEPIHGGCADIYRGTSGDDAVAVKVLRIPHEENAKIIFTELCKEAILWRQLGHPNVIPFLGFSTDVFPTRFALISPWMDNGDLMRFLRDNEDVDRVNIARQIASGLSYLHSRNPQIIHGDLRANNVLVDAKRNALITDFGISRVNVLQTRMSVQSNRGSARWQAPELHFSPEGGLSFNTTRSDVYAFGMTSYEVFTGEIPYAEFTTDGSVVMEVCVHKRKPKRPSDPILVARGLSDIVWRLLEDCWEHDPKRRPTMDEIGVVLQGDAVAAEENETDAHKEANPKDVFEDEQSDDEAAEYPQALNDVEQKQNDDISDANVPSHTAKDHEVPTQAISDEEEHVQEAPIDAVLIQAVTVEKKPTLKDEGKHAERIEEVEKWSPEPASLQHIAVKGLEQPPREVSLPLNEITVHEDPVVKTTSEARAGEAKAEEISAETIRHIFPNRSNTEPPPHHHRATADREDSSPAILTIHTGTSNSHQKGKDLMLKGNPALEDGSLETGSDSVSDALPNEVGNVSSDPADDLEAAWNFENDSASSTPLATVQEKSVALDAQNLQDLLGKPTVVTTQELRTVSDLSTSNIQAPNPSGGIPKINSPANRRTDSQFSTISVVSTNTSFSGLSGFSNGILSSPDTSPATSPSKSNDDFNDNLFYEKMGITSEHYSNGLMFTGRIRYPVGHELPNDNSPIQLPVRPSLNVIQPRSGRINPHPTVVAPKMGSSDRQVVSMEDGLIPPTYQLGSRQEIGASSPVHLSVEDKEKYKRTASVSARSGDPSSSVKAKERIISLKNPAQASTEKPESRGRREDTSKTHSARLVQTPPKGPSEVGTLEPASTDRPMQTDQADVTLQGQAEAKALGLRKRLGPVVRLPQGSPAMATTNLPDDWFEQTLSTTDPNRDVDKEGEDGTSSSPNDDTPERQIDKDVKEFFSKRDVTQCNPFVYIPAGHAQVLVSKLSAVALVSSEEDVQLVGKLFQHAAERSWCSDEDFEDGISQAIASLDRSVLNENVVAYSARVLLKGAELDDMRSQRVLAKSGIVAVRPLVKVKND